MEADSKMSFHQPYFALNRQLKCFPIQLPSCMRSLSVRQLHRHCRDWHRECRMRRDDCHMGRCTTRNRTGCLAYGLVIPHLGPAILIANFVSKVRKRRHEMKFLHAHGSPDFRTRAELLERSRRKIGGEI